MIKLILFSLLISVAVCQDHHPCHGATNEEECIKGHGYINCGWCNTGHICIEYDGCLRIEQQRSNINCADGFITSKNTSCWYNNLLSIIFGVCIIPCVFMLFIYICYSSFELLYRRIERIERIRNYQEI